MHSHICIIYVKNNDFITRTQVARANSKFISAFVKSSSLNIMRRIPMLTSVLRQSGKGKFLMSFLLKPN